MFLIYLGLFLSISFLFYRRSTTSEGRQEQREGKLAAEKTMKTHSIQPSIPYVPITTKKRTGEYRANMQGGKSKRTKGREERTEKK